MHLGAFSVSLAVKDLAASRQFYEALGFAPFAGDPTQGWQILKQGTTVIGLFQGMFEHNLLTFNPRWNSDAEEVPGAPDIREIQRHLAARGIVPAQPIDESGSGPAHFVIVDPDGNQILLDQHV
jgi:lactoylglutathione lyase